MNTKPMARSARAMLLAAVLASASLSSWADNKTIIAPTAAVAGNGADNVDWTEEAVPPPPAFDKSKLVPLEMPPYVSLKVGVDPQTIAVGGDGVVRYVIVMVNSSGTTTAVYEGIRCTTDEVKTYARFSAAGSWTLLDNPTWKPVNDNTPSRHSHVFARQGGCQNRLALSPREIVSQLKQGKGSKAF